MYMLNSPIWDAMVAVSIFGFLVLSVVITGSLIYEFLNNRER